MLDADLVTLKLLIFRKSLKFGACSHDFANDLKHLEQLINELLRKLHCDVLIFEKFECSTQELNRILRSEEGDMLECERFLSH